MEQQNAAQVPAKEPAGTDPTVEVAPTSPEGVDPGTDPGGLEAKNKQLFARAKKAEDEAKQLREKLVNTPQVPSVPQVDAPTTDVPIESLADNLALLNSIGDQSQSMIKTAKELGIDPIKFMKSDAGKNHLVQLRAKAKVERATPAPTNRANTTEKEKPYSKQTSDEKNKNYGFDAWRKKKAMNQG